MSRSRIEALCLGECQNPSDERRLIDRIEVVRIRPQASPDEDVASLVEEQWKTFECAPDPAGCVVEFEDPDYATSGRDAVYYVRVLEEPSLQVNGDPLRCERDSDGRCIATRPCRPGGEGADADNCMDLQSARAWSSPIFLDQIQPIGQERGDG